MKRRTVLVMAHRLATVKNADRVVVVQCGRIAEMGTQDELMAREDGIYRRLATLQALDLSASRQRAVVAQRSTDITPGGVSVATLASRP